MILEILEIEKTNENRDNLISQLSIKCGNFLPGSIRKLTRYIRSSKINIHSFS